MTDTYRPFNSTIRVISENEYGKMRNDKCARNEPEQIHLYFLLLGKWEKLFIQLLAEDLEKLRVREFWKIDI